MRGYAVGADGFYFLERRFGTGFGNFALLDDVAVEACQELKIPLGERVGTIDLNEMGASQSSCSSGSTALWNSETERTAPFWQVRLFNRRAPVLVRPIHRLSAYFSVFCLRAMDLGCQCSDGFPMCGR